MVHNISLTNITVDKSTDLAKPLSICFLNTTSTSKFPSYSCLRADKGIAGHDDAAALSVLLLTITAICGKENK